MSDNDNRINRRDFVKTSGKLTAAVVAASGLLSGVMLATRKAAAQDSPEGKLNLTEPIPTRKFGKHDVQVSIIGLGGAHLSAPKDEALAIRIVHEALDAGMNFMDNAWDYGNGKSEERMGKALKDRRDKAFLMTKVCTHGRDANVAMKQLEESLKRLQTDYIDLWQIHEVAYENDPELHFQEGGVVEALLKAKEQGKVKYLGFTGHKDPSLHKRMLSHDFPFDAVQMPLNPFDASFRSFENEILPELNKRQIAAIGMKSLGGNASMVNQGVITAEEGIRYAMSLPVTTTVCGMETIERLHQNLKIASGFQAMESTQMAELRTKCKTQAQDGRHELYKVTAKFEGPEGRKQHGFPLG